ncbi:MAG TPA: aldo/keto reductase [Casimicrobiaceae bacterium]
MITLPEALRRTPLGNGPPVSRLGFGAAPLGNLYTPVAEDEALEAVRAAYDGGIRYFDTAPLYGHGMSEHRCGQVLRQYPRDSFTLSTKVGRVLRAGRDAGEAFDGYADALPFRAVYDYSYDGAMRSFEDSLQRLGTDRIDILLVHDIDVRTHGIDEQKRRFDESVNGAFKALCRLRDDGVVAAIGLGVNEVEVCLAVADTVDIDCLLLAGRYSLLEQGALDALLPLCASRQIGVIVGGPFNSGILATGATRDARYDYRLAPTQVAERVGRIEAVCKRHRVPLAAAALQFPYGHPAVASVIPGARTRAEVGQNLALLQIAIPADLWRELKAEGLLRLDAPCPVGGDSA